MKSEGNNQTSESRISEKRSQHTHQMGKLEHTNRYNIIYDADDIPLQR